MFWMGKRFDALPDHRLIDEGLAPDFVRQMTRRYAIATLIDVASVAIIASQIGIATAGS